MKFKIKIDFCVIPDPYSSSGFKNLVFVAYSGSNKISEKLCLEEDYETIKFLLNKYGYQEIDFCTFESSVNSAIHVDDLKSKLSQSGLKYSKPFEFNIMGEINSFHRDVMEKQQDELSFTKSDNNITFYTTNSVNAQSKTKYKVPEIGGKISLNFYLFLQCHFLSDCILELVGDLYSKENDNTRNYLQITSSDFTRLESKNPEVLLLQSKKTYADFLSELNFLHKGGFKFVKPSMGPGGDMVMKTREFTYNIMEIKKNINPVHRIVVEVNINQYYDDMISVSKKIKKELSREQKRIMSLESVRPEVFLLKQKLKDKMLVLAEGDEFEKASLIKKDISFLEEKIQAIDQLEEKNITHQEYFKTFCLNS